MVNRDFRPPCRCHYTPIEHTPHVGLRQYKVFAVVAGNQWYRIWQYEGDATYWGELYGHGLPSTTCAGFESQAAAEKWLVGLGAHIVAKRQK